ncbi:MAG TPA: heparan-alpha-glucosaminide N-acetyltransferase domain-containing protein [Gemmatimonadales bacterium]|nr:heparan-alpha-glucosaminide N-acetyltransferase domain-containing protein [Gemmatimonadales bacterium]
MIALDAFRGMTIAGMLLVNNPGTWGAIYPPLEHAPWHGWTPTDLIFPFFVFIVGITTHLSLSARARRGDPPGAITAQVVRRGLLIILFGLLLQAFPYFPLTRITQLRFPGVLQRIGVCYLAAALLTRGRSTRGVVGMVAGLLFGYWALQALVAPPGVAAPTLDVPENTLSAWIDRSVFGSHLWQQSRTWDPEGLLSTLPAIGTCLLGLLAGRWLANDSPLPGRLKGLLAAGAIAMVAGLVWDRVFPINKNLWTSSYVLFTAGMACLAIATCAWLIEIRGWRKWAAPFVSYGLNPMLAFVGSGMMARVLGLIRLPGPDGLSVTLQQAIYRPVFASWLAPKSASLGFALAFVALWYGILRVLERRGVVFRV